MITYEQAYETALKKMPNIDACVEYENAYMFKRKASSHSIGGDGFLVILKDSGEIISRTEYNDKNATEIVREFDITTETRGGSGSKDRKTRK